MPGAAVPLRDRRAQEPELAHLREHLGVRLAPLVPLADVRQDLGLDERAGALAHEALLVGQGEVDHGGWRASGVRDACRILPPRVGPARLPILGRWTPSTTRTPPPTRPRPRGPRGPEHVAGHRPLHGPQLVARRRPPPRATPTAASTSTSPTASRSPRWATRTRGSRPRSTPRSTGSWARSTRSGFSEPTVRLAAMLADTFPDPLDSVLFLNSGSEAIDGALKLARRVTGRPGIIAFRGAFHGRTFGATSVTTSSLNYRTGYEPLLPGVYFAPFPAVYPEFRGDEAAATASSLAILGSLLKTVHRAVTGRRDPDRARPGRGRLLPGAGRLPAGPARPVRRARDPADRRRGPVGLRPDRRDVGLRARRRSSPTSCASRRPSPTDCRCRRS